MGTAELFGLPTPCYVVDESQLMRNLQILRSVSEQSGCKILLAQKAFLSTRHIRLLAGIWPVRKPAACMKRVGKN